MNFQWMLLAFFLIAVLVGTLRALKRSMLKNVLRLASVVIAFLTVFFLQLGGVFQNAVSRVADTLGVASLLPVPEGATTLVLALVSTLVACLTFGLFFLPILWFLRIVIHFSLKGVEKKKRVKAELAVVAEQEGNIQSANEAVTAAVDEAASLATESETAASEENVQPANETAIAEDDETATPKPESETAADDEIVSPEIESETAERNESAPSAVMATETVALVAETEAEPVEKPNKKKKAVFYHDCAWKRAVSAAVGIVSGVLILSVLMMPTFYSMSIVRAATDALESSDAEDSQVYQVVSVVDEYIATPYEKSVVGGFYDAVCLSDLMCYTVKLGGRIELDETHTVYADDVIKKLLFHGVSAAAQATSLKTECPTIKDDVNAIVSNPAVSHIVTDVLMEMIADMEMKEVEEDDLVGELVNHFIQHYKEADRATLEKDVCALGNVLGILAEERVLLELIDGEADFSEMLKDEEMLGGVVEAMSGLSAFAPALEDAFKLGVEILGEVLVIPADDAEVYRHLVDDLLLQMKRSDNTKFDINTIRYYIVNCEKNGVKVSATNGIKGHSQFVAYASHWEKVQSAFAHASEDTSYGYFTMEINGQWYVYDKNAKTILLYNEETRDAYKDKISPVAGLVNALTLYSTTSLMTEENLHTILRAYVASASDEVSVALARRMLDEEGFVSPAVTVEKMLAATDFTDWTEEEKAKDSRLCVSIVVNLLSVMDHLENVTGAGNLEDAAHMLDEFTILGETMDDMKKTSCIGKLPPLLLEGLVKNEIFVDYMKPAVAFRINAIAEESKTYEDCMKQIAAVLKWAIHSLGGEIA